MLTQRGARRYRCRNEIPEAFIFVTSEAVSVIVISYCSLIARIDWYHYTRGRQSIEASRASYVCMRGSENALTHPGL
jgi:hypothetical protein